MTKQELLNGLVRDLTKVGSIPKSEARRRIQEYAESVVRERLKKMVNIKFPRGERKWCVECAERIKKEILAAKDKFNIE